MARNTQPPEGEPVTPEPETPGPEVPTEPAALEELTVPELETEKRAGGNVVEADLADALTVDIDELETERQAALADVQAASERANELHRQITEARGPDVLQAAGLPPLIAVAEASAAALTPTPVED